MAPMRSLVSRNVSKSYGAVTALESMDLDVAQGEFLCILGPTGCGKSTFLNLVAGFEEPTTGDIQLAGHSIDRPGPDRAMVFQEHGLYPWLTVEANIKLGPRIRGVKQVLAAKEAHKLIELVGLSGFERHYPYQLSGGMCQRAALARTLINEPQVLLMDEPFAALDALTRAQMQQLLLSIWSRTDATVLFVTHDIDEALLLADRVLVLTPRPGRLAAELRVPLARPRSYETTMTDEFIRLKRQLMAELKTTIPEMMTGD